jgi:LytS/YehU family sensor histidine kinase
VIFLAYAWFSSPIYNWISLAACFVGFLVALGVSVGAVWRRRRGAVFACLGIGLSMIALARAPGDFLDHAFFISAGPAVLGLFVAVMLQLRDERREAQRALLAEARLETELLKKNIQPHFLLNTLATIQEVIEQEPRTAVALIDALAGEFRILSRVSGEKLIPIEQELELCRAHLQVMSLRKGARCTLEVAGLDPQAQVPPALFHTLIENGLTHLLPRDGRMKFELQATRLNPGVRYRLLALGEKQPEVSTASETVATESARPREGTGLRYIKARLEESFTGRWTLAGAAVTGGWGTTIEIRSPDAMGSGAAADTRIGGVVKEQPI